MFAQMAAQQPFPDRSAIAEHAWQVMKEQTP
jgi:hypothetical protein